MKNSIIKVILLLVSTTVMGQDYNSLFTEGVKAYKQKDNNSAEEYLTEAQKINNSGEVNYYLGNVRMNLNQYKNAIECYENAIRSNYQLNNSIFNIACAYSLLKENSQCAEFLIINFLSGDKKITRIEKDADLLNFRESNYYNIFKKSIKNINGNELKSPKEVLKFLKTSPQGITDLNDLDPPTISFDSDGTYSHSFDSCFTQNGYWKVNLQSGNLEAYITKIHKSGKDTIVNELDVYCHYTNITVNKFVLCKDESGLPCLMICNDFGGTVFFENFYQFTSKLDAK